MCVKISMPTHNVESGIVSRSAVHTMMKSNENAIER